MVQIYNIMDLQKILTLDLVSFETSTAVNVILAVISVCLLIFFKRKLYRNRDKWSFGLSTPRTTDTSDSPISEDGASMFSRVTFSWVHPILTKRSKSANLSIDDMFHMPYNIDVKRVQVAFSKLLRPNDDRSPKTKQTMPSLLQMLVKAYGREVFLYGGFLELFSALISLVGPIYIGFLVSFFENGTEPSHVGYRYVFILFLSTFGKTLVNSKFHSSKWHILSNVRTSVMTSIYRKVLHLNSASLTKFNVGEIVNFLGPDTDRLMGACNSLHTVWSFPLQVTIFTYVLYRLLGIASLSGLVLALVLVPVNKIISTEKIDLRKSLMRKKDEKMKLMNEILGGIKIIKLYAWEEHFRKMIEELREAELQIIKRRKILEGIAGYVWTLAPICMTVLTFSAYCMMGNTLTAAKMLGTLSLLQRLLQTLTQIPSIFDDMIEGAISLGRIEKFMALEDIDYKRYYDTVPETKKDRIVVSVNKGNFTWKDEDWISSESGKKQTDFISRSVEETTASVTLCLRDINVDVEYGQFIGVIGKVGSGKSSLLNAILAEMFRKEGEISVSLLQNGFALADQEPWIQHATVRDNIIFGRPFEAKKYAHILDAASLGKDIEMLPAGDKTEVGENGVTLSGGQKSRLALARALYQDKDVYLLDDPLAAVDAHVAQHMYDKCIMGLLKNKTRILCTHHTNFLGEADLVIVMNDGIIAKMGPPSEVLTDIKFAERRSSERENIDVNKNDKSGNDGKLGDETKIVGDVKLEVYKAYFAALGKWFSVAIVLSIVSMQASMVAKDWWLTHWVSNANIDAVKASVPGYQCFYHNMSTPNSLHGRYDPKPIETFRHSSLLYYMVVYACLSAVYSLFSLAKDILFAYTGMTVARITHNNLLNSMLKAPMSFYDVTPAGRILSRFSSDMAIIDDYISHTVMTVLELLFIVIRTVTVTCYVMPWFLVIIVPITAVYNQLQKRYRHTSREVRRVASLYRSPIFSHFAESISGSVTIRAFRESERFIDELNHRLDTWFKAHYTRENLRLWLWFRTQMFGVTMVTAIATLAVIQHGVCGIDPGIVGLTMSYIITLASILNESVNFATTIERDMVSVERIYQYIEETPSEKWEGFQSVSAWPSAGVISYTDVFMKYRDGLPNVLKGLTFSTRPAEKMGIVGRTGSGKSSLFQTLFRTVEISSGDITIDGVNIQQLDLKDVRRHLAVIPQDPFLFSGTVRENLDPTSSYSDQELWGVLDRCHLRVPVDRLGGLQGEVGEKGRQFSVGQKQLMCLARALLTKAKVLCIDEATASVDLETDKLIQETIRQEFVNSTVLTIAHRINTIMDSDRVLVMDQGQVAELDSPENLLKNPQSQFYQLVHGKQSEE